MGGRALTTPETGLKWHNTISKETKRQRLPAPALMRRPGGVLAVAGLGSIWGSLVCCQGREALSGHAGVRQTWHSSRSCCRGRGDVRKYLFLSSNKVQFVPSCCAVFSSFLPPSLPLPGPQVPCPLPLNPPPWHSWGCHPEVRSGGPPCCPGQPGGRVFPVCKGTKCISFSVSVCLSVCACVCFPCPICLCSMPAPHDCLPQHTLRAGPWPCWPPCRTWTWGPGRWRCLSAWWQVLPTWR